MTLVSKSRVAKSAMEEATRMYCPKREPVNSRSFSTGTTTPREVVLRIKPRRTGFLLAPDGAKNVAALNAINRVLRNMNTPFLADFLGVLDANGEAAAKLDTFGPISSSFVGVVMNFAFACDGPWDYVSNPVSVEIIDV